MHPNIQQPLLTVKTVEYKQEKGRGGGKKEKKMSEWCKGK